MKYPKTIIGPVWNVPKMYPIDPAVIDIFSYRHKPLLLFIIGCEFEIKRWGGGSKVCLGVKKRNEEFKKVKVWGYDFKSSFVT